MPTDTITIKAIPERGRWRAGRHFTRAGVSINVAELAEGELEAIRNDPLLQVVGELPASDAKPPTHEGDLCYRVLKPFKHKGAQITPTAGDDNAPVSIQLNAKDAKKLGDGGFISTAEGDVSLPPDKVD